MGGTRTSGGGARSSTAAEAACRELRRGGGCRAWREEQVGKGDLCGMLQHEEGGRAGQRD